MWSAAVLADTVLIHFILAMDDERMNFSQVIHSLKRNFTLNYKKHHTISTSLKLWQSRFWDHVIQDEKDLGNHIDYIHWNPVKHGFTFKPEDWPHSSYNQWVNSGYYPNNWGWEAEPESIKDMEFE